MATIEKPPVYSPSTEPCTIKLDEPACIGCGAYVRMQGMVTLEEAFKSLLCDKCKGTLRAFRYLAEQSLNEGEKVEKTNGEKAFFSSPDGRLTVVKGS
jgi:hypothetical protein